jgi:CPA2 family monovalent cation:H+ antiporter-2
MRVGMGMAQIGEFSFIIAALGITLGVSSNFLFPIAVAVSVLTTFLTPYLIKHSDQITPLLYKIIPLKVSGFFNWYTTWLQNIQTRQIETGIRKIVRRSLVQTALNLFIIIGIFLGVAYLANTDWIKLMSHILNENIYKTLAWSAAVILSLPFIVGIYRKIKALSMLLAEFTVRKKVDQVLPLTTRRIIAEIIPIISLVVILLFVFALSVSILPPIELLIISSGFIIILVVLLYSRLVKLHAKLQIRFLDAMKKESDHSDI